MLLYHGTNGAWTRNILKRGLEPRKGRVSRNNWRHVPHQSNPNCVYLTDSYAPYFCWNAMRGKDPQCAVFEIDTKMLDGRNLLADEDALEQVTRGIDDGCPVTGLSPRTLWYRSRQRDIASITLKDGREIEAWEYSLDRLGTCCHWGTIPAAAISRVATWPHNPNKWLRVVWDPTITVLNQMICGDRYRALTAKLFGDTPAPISDEDGRIHAEWDQRAIDSFDPANIEGLEVSAPWLEDSAA